MKRFIAIILAALTILCPVIANGETAQPEQENAAPSGTISAVAFEIPPFDQEPVIELNKNMPAFYVQELKTESFVSFNKPDALGRTGVAQACIGQDILPTASRDAIGDIKPSGWQTVRYDDLIEDHYLYNRCHLVGYQLCGRNDAENLFTGTRYLNVELMLPYESKITEYVKSTGNHVLFRATPIYWESDLVATGVQFEGFSVEDIGAGVCFNVFLYNIQPGIIIEYADGTSARDPDYTPAAVSTPEPLIKLGPAKTDEAETTRETPKEEETERSTTVTYVLNTNSHKFHYPSCSSVGSMSKSNKREFFGSRDEAISDGYVPCKKCNP